MKKIIFVTFLIFLFLSCYSDPNYYDDMCYVCGGTGRCYMCNGRGYLNLEDKCYACNGSGKCINCNGSGKIIKPFVYMTQIKENKLSVLYKK